MTQPKPALYELIPVDSLETNIGYKVGEKYYEGLEIEPNPFRKYVISVEVGDLPPHEIGEAFRTFGRMARDFFGGEVLLIPSRHGHPSAKIYQIKVASEAE